MRGEIKDFSESLRRRVALLKDVPAEALEQVYTEKLRLNPGAERLITTAQAAGIKVLLDVYKRQSSTRTTRSSTFR